MTLFVVILIIFLICQFNSVHKRKDKYNNYIKSITSNAREQYDIGCKAIKEMGEMYRALSANKTFEERFHCLPCYDEIKNHSLSDKTKYFLTNKPLFTDNVYSNYNEERWIIATALACELAPTNDIMKHLYRENIWKLIPKQFSTKFMDEWKQKFKSTLNDADLELCLKNSIDMKNQIIYNKNGGCYKDYNDKSIVKIVAQQFNMPNDEELDLLHMLPYRNINDLVQRYTDMKIREQGYCPADCSYVPNPTEEEKQKEYSALSYEEQQRKEFEKRREVRKKYYPNR